MLRAAGAQIDLPTRRHSGFNDYRKDAKESQGPIHKARLALQQISKAELCLLALLLVVCCGVAALVLANRDLQADKHAPNVLKALKINAMTPADEQIQRYEHEKAQVLSDLELALKQQADLQADVSARHESISQLHSRIQNLTDLTVQAQYNSTHGLPIIVEQATVDTKIAEQTAIWEEEIGRLKKQVQQEESAAVVTGQRIKSTASEVLASRQKYQAKSAAAEMLRKHRVDSIESKALEPSKAQQAGSNEAEEAKTGNQQTNIQGRAVQDNSPVGKVSGRSADSTKGSSGSAAKGTSDGDSTTALGTRGEEDVRGLSPAVNLNEAMQDDSVRCRMSGICEGLDACGRGDGLGCIVNTTERQQKVKEGMQWAWKGYRAYAWGEDELLPHSQQSNRWFGLGLTLIDSLDTLQMMGLETELGEAREWVGRNLILDQDTTVNLFETTIRILGGLLSAFYLSGGDRLYLYKAVELGMRMTPGFHSPSGIPWSDVNLQNLKGLPPTWTASSSLSEATSLTLEYFTLGSAMGHPDLGKLAREVVAKIGNSGECEEGVCPTWVNPHSGTVHGDKLSLGSRGDSYYEYLLKHWILTGKKDKALLKQYSTAMKGVRKLLLLRTSPAPEGLLYVAEKRRNQPIQDPKMDHLVCFLPGVFALGHLHGVSTGGQGEPNDLEVARQLMLTCYEMYRRIPTGLSPEIVFFTQHDRGDDYPKQHHMDVGSGDFMVKQQDSHNLLRPETVESLFVLHQVTGDPQYQDWGWHIFRAFEKFSKVDSGGYTNLDSVLSVPPPHRDKMESFWTGETLKYLYMLLDPSKKPAFPLDEWVFNTEAHPLPVIGSAAEQAVKHQYLSSAEMTHHLSGYREAAHLAEWVQEWQKLDAEYVGQQFPPSTARRILHTLADVL